MTNEQFGKCMNLINDMDDEIHPIHSGSPKQIAWAEKIRTGAKEKIQSIKDLPSEKKALAVKIFNHVCNAQIWIDNKYAPTDPILAVKQFMLQIVKVHNL